MSGSSYNYAYRTVEEMAECLRDVDTNPMRRKFRDHLRLVARAMHDVEWVDSCDYSSGDENAAIEACLRAYKELA